MSSLVPPPPGVGAASTPGVVVPGNATSHALVHAPSHVRVCFSHSSQQNYDVKGHVDFTR